MRFLSHLIFAAIVCFGANSHGTETGLDLKQIWAVANQFDVSTLGAGVDIVQNDAIEAPAQIYITPERTWIEYSPILRKIFSDEQFDFIIYHELGHLYLDHQKKFEEAEARSPGSGMPLRRLFVLESDQFGVLIYSKFGKDWNEIEKLITRLIERNTTGDWIPTAKERESAMRTAREFYLEMQK